MALHWWHTERLRSELAKDSLSEPDSLKYMLLAVFLFVYGSYVSVWLGAYRDWGFVFEALLVLAIGLIGTHECFKANGGSNGRAFLLRFSALAVPVGLKVAIFSTLVSQAVYFGFAHVVTPSVFRDPEFIYRFVSFVLPLVWAFVYYWRIAYHIAQIPNARGSVA
jgi:hypothetical protein